jgi:hypothetical protein
MQTQTGAKLPNTFHSSPPHALYVTSTEVFLVNNDRCIIGQHVIVQQRLGHGFGQPFIAIVREIIQQVGSSNHDDGRADGLLLQSIRKNTLVLGCPRVL